MRLHLQRKASRRTKVVGALIVLGVISGAGMAWAWWSASGAGAGRAQALTAQQVTVTAVTGTADLYPGFEGGDLSFTLTNSNPYAVTFASMTPGSVTVDGAHSAGCAAANVTVSLATGLQLEVDGGTTSASLAIADVVSMAPEAPDACQGATFTVALTLTGVQRQS